MTRVFIVITWTTEIQPWDLKDACKFKKVNYTHSAAKNVREA
jgi:hypothetical protein